MEQQTFFKSRYRVTIEDQDSKNAISTMVEMIEDDVESVAVGLSKAVKEIVMSNGTKEEQTQDLVHQKPEETDNLSKSARPDKSYTDSKDLDPDTLGKK